MDAKREMACYIVDLFDDLLEEKKIVIPCADESEERDRREGGSCARLYGMEYWNLVDRVEALLNKLKAE